MPGYNLLNLCVLFYSFKFSEGKGDCIPNPSDCCPLCLILDGFYLSPGVCCSTGTTLPEEDPLKKFLPGVPLTSAHLGGLGSVEANQRAKEGPAGSSGPGGLHRHGWEVNSVWQVDPRFSHPWAPGPARWTSMRRGCGRRGKERGCWGTSKALPPLTWSLESLFLPRAKAAPSPFSLFPLPPRLPTADRRNSRRKRWARHHGSKPTDVIPKIGKNAGGPDLILHSL